MSRRRLDISLAQNGGGGIPLRAGANWVDAISLPFESRVRCAQAHRTPPHSRTRSEEVGFEPTDDFWPSQVSNLFD